MCGDLTDTLLFADEARRIRDECLRYWADIRDDLTLTDDEKDEQIGGVSLLARDMLNQLWAFADIITHQCRRDLETSLFGDDAA